MEHLETVSTGSALRPAPGPVAQQLALPSTETFSAAVAPDTWDDEEMTVECAFYTGATVPRVDWTTGDSYDLALSLDPAAVRLARLNNGGAVIDNHNIYDSVQNQLGVTENARIEDGVAKARLRFSPRPDLEDFRKDVKLGILRNVSVGATIFKKVDTTPAGAIRKSMLATDWEPYEISFTQVPADPGAQLLRGASGDLQLLGRARRCLPHGA
jgi:hypothetical protein